MESTKKTTKAAEGRKKAATKTTKAEALTEATKTTKTTKTAEKAEEKKREKTMKKTAEKTAAATKAAPKTEAAATILTPEALKALHEEAKTAATPDARQAARERFDEGREAFNAAALKAAVDNASFLNAAEAFRPEAPKTEAAKKNGVDYNRRAERVAYIVVDEDGNAAARFLNLNVYAAEAFRRGLVTEAQNKTMTAALTALDVFLKKNVEEDSHEGLKAAAAALTALVEVCGLNDFTKTADGFSFFVHRSFILATAARMKARRGVFMTPNAVFQEACAAALTAAHDKRTKAAERANKAGQAAVKSVFNIISEALKAAIYGVYRAEVLTAEGVKAAAALKAEEEAKKAAERAKAAKAKAAKKAKAAEERAEKAAERAAALKAKAEAAAEAAKKSA